VKGKAVKKDSQSMIRQVSSVLVLIAVLLSPAPAARTGRADEDRESRQTAKELQKEKMRQEALQSFPEVDNALKAILEKVKKNQKPEPSAIEQGVQLLNKNKRNSLAYDDTQRARYMLLKAWTDFYQDAPDEAVNWAMRAVKTDAASGDAWISQGLFCLLNGKRPMTPRIQKPKPQRRTDSDSGHRTRQPQRRTDSDSSRRTRQPRRRNGNDPSPEINVSTTQPYGQKGDLEFDMSALRIDMLKERFARCQYQAVDGSMIEYIPGQDTLCLLLWKGSSEPVDANEMPGSPVVTDSMDQVAQQMPDEMLQRKDLLSGVGRGYVTNRHGSDLPAQRAYIQAMMDACKDRPDIKFMQVDTVRSPASSGNMADYISQSIPTVIAAMPASNAEQIAGIKADTPFAMVVDKEGKVCYAGPAANFMPAFILSTIAEVEIDLTKQNQSDGPDMMFSPGRQLRRDMMYNEFSSALKKAGVDPNSIEIDPNSMPADPKVPMPPRPPQQQMSEELSIEYQAGKDLEYAEFFIDAAKKRAQTYKKGVELCRKIIREHPGTKYEREARLLLREVPEPKRKTYKITDEELMLP
jgi:hypothetical protein